MFLISYERVKKEHYQPRGKDDPDTIKHDLLNGSSDFSPIVKDRINNSGNFIRNDLADGSNQPRNWYTRKVVFIGDSIHATTPNLAQGGCQTIEVAYA